MTGELQSLLHPFFNSELETLVEFRDSFRSLENIISLLLD